jgi:hypothetical protein
MPNMAGTSRPFILERDARAGDGSVAYNAAASAVEP